MLKLALSLTLIALVTGCHSPNSQDPSSGPTPTAMAQPHTGVPVALRTLHFSGYAWTVKAATDGPVGPGPNYFADGPDNVWVDDTGRLHLRIDYKHGQWWAAEVVSTHSFGYGTYRFFLDTNIDALDPNAVLGLFTWSDAPAFHHREIDIEIARWGQADNENGQCVVQPYDRPENLVRFALPRGLRTSIHSLTWGPDRVVCQGLQGVAPSPVPPSTLLYEHMFTTGIPEPGGENVRINLWLLGGQGTQHGQDVEVVIRRFEFLPL